MGSAHLRSRTLTEQFGSFPQERDVPTIDRPVTPQAHDIEFCSARDRAIQEARCQAFETPSAPRFGAIPSEVDTSYPQEWNEGAHSGKYSTIPGRGLQFC